MGIIFTFLLLLLGINIFSQTIPRKIKLHGLVSISRNFFPTPNLTVLKFNYSRVWNRSALSYLDFRYIGTFQGFKSRD